MKRNHIFPLLLAMLGLSSCDKDRLGFYLEEFKVNDQFVDQEGKYAPDAILNFEIRFRAEDGEDGDYAIEDFDFTYTVNGSQPFFVQSDRNMNVDAFNLNAVVDLLNIALPPDLGNELIPGDEIVFTIWARDSDDDSIQRSFKVLIQ